MTSAVFRRTDILLDGKPVSKLTAVTALRKVDGSPVKVCEVTEDGIEFEVLVYARRRAYGEVAMPEVNWSALGSVSPEQALRYADLIILAAGLAQEASL